MMEVDTVSETLDCNSILTRLIAREDIIAFISRENLKSYKSSKFYFYEFLWDTSRPAPVVTTKTLSMLCDFEFFLHLHIISQKIQIDYR
jgi:hypothetical protein